MRIGPHTPTSFNDSFKSHHSVSVKTPNKITTAKKPNQFAMPSPLALRRTFLSIRITWLIEFMLDVLKALLQLRALVPQYLLEILHVGHLCILSLVFSWTYHYQTSVPG